MMTVQDHNGKWWVLDESVTFSRQPFNWEGVEITYWDATTETWKPIEENNKP